jgi:hypothetical protein
MSPLEILFRLEIDYQRRLRTLAPCMPDACSLHTSYALQFGYDSLLRSLSLVTAREVEALRERLIMTSDTRDILAAHDSLKQLLGITTS